MLAVKKDLSSVVYSVGKTGTTSLLNVLDNQWVGVGENSASFMFDLAAEHYNSELYHGQQTNHVDQYNAVLYLAQSKPKIYCVIRDPWKRYISGLKEVLGDSISALGDNIFQTVWNQIFTNEQMLTAHIDRLYYLTEYRSPTEELAQFALHQNYHMRNWLHEVQYLVDNHNAEVVLNHNLDNLILELGLLPRERQNVSQLEHIAAVESAFKRTGIYNANNLQYYLNREIDLYNCLVPESPVKKLELV